RSPRILTSESLQLDFERGRIAFHKLSHEVLLTRHVFSDFFDVVEIVRERSVNVAKSYRWNLFDNLIGRHGHVLVPDNNIHHAHAMPRDAGFAAANARCSCDSLGYYFAHVPPV